MVLIILLSAWKTDLLWAQHRKSFVINLLQTYGQLIGKKRTKIFLPLMVCLLLQKLSFSAILETRLEEIEQTVYVHILMSVLPEEEVSGIQLECAYNIQNWEFVSAFSGETLYASEKQLQIAPVYGSLRILIIGLNNYPIPSGELFTLQFNTFSESVDKPGFRILNVKLSSPQALPVTGIINNKEEETNGNSEFEKESNTVDISNTNSSIETTPQSYSKLPNVTNSINLRPNTREMGDKIVTPTHTQPSSSKSYNPILSSGYFPEIKNPFILNQRQQENNKKEIQANISNPINVSRKPHIIERQNGFDSRTLLTNQVANSPNKNVKTAPLLRNAQTRQIGGANTLDNSLPKSKKFYVVQDKLTTHKLPDNVTDTLHNTYLALNVSNLPSTRGRSNECTQKAINLIIDNTSRKENTLTLLVSIIITVLALLILLPTLLKRNPFLSKGKSKK